MAVMGIAELLYQAKFHPKKVFGVLPDGDIISYGNLFSCVNKLAYRYLLNVIPTDTRGNVQVKYSTSDTMVMNTIQSIRTVINKMLK
jgi:hypothetical protein